MIEPVTAFGGHRAKWKPFTDAVLAMKLHDLLVWDILSSDLRTAKSRLDDARHSEFKVFSKWYNGKLFIVRVL